MCIVHNVQYTVYTECNILYISIYVHNNFVSTTIRTVCVQYFIFIMLAIVLKIKEHTSMSPSPLEKLKILFLKFITELKALKTNICMIQFHA